MQRPELCKDLNCDTFKEYYYLKEELIAFCKKHSLDYNDGKIDITNRIYYYLKSETRIPSSKKTHKARNHDIIINIDSLVESPFVCTETHRAFFTSIIGSKFKFNVSFQNYLKSNEKKTYAQAIEKWYELDEYSKRNKGKSKIAKQFEYNTYTRDFFADNKGFAIQDAIKCWKYKKSLPGHNKYERSDLSALDD